MELDRCSDLEASLGAYALGQVDERLSMRVQLHLAEGCVGCATRLEELVVRFHLAALPEQAGLLPDAFSERVLRAAVSVEQDRPEPVIVYPQTPERPLLWTLVALSFVMVAAVAFWGQRQERDLRSVQARSEFMEQAAQRTVDELGALQSVVRRMTDPSSQMVDVSTTGAAFAAVRTRILYNPVSREIWLRASGLPPTDADGRYALWLGVAGSDRLLGALLPQVLGHGGTSHFELPGDVTLPVALRLYRQSVSSLEAGAVGDDLVLEAILGSASD